MMDGSVILQHVGARMRLARQSANIRLGDMAEKLSVHANQIGRYEAGKAAAPIHRIVQWAMLTGQPPAFFFEGLPNKTGEDAPVPIEAFMDPWTVDIVLAASRMTPKAREKLAAFLREAAVGGPPTGVAKPPTFPDQRPPPRKGGGVREPIPEV